MATEKLNASLKRAGINVLENEIKTIEKNGQKIRLFGLKDHLKINSLGGFRFGSAQASQKRDRKATLSFWSTVLMFSPILRAHSYSRKRF